MVINGNYYYHRGPNAVAAVVLYSGLTWGGGGTVESRPTATFWTRHTGRRARFIKPLPRFVLLFFFLIRSGKHETNRSVGFVSRRAGRASDQRFVDLFAIRPRTETGIPSDQRVRRVHDADGGFVERDRTGLVRGVGCGKKRVCLRVRKSDRRCDVSPVILIVAI